MDFLYFYRRCVRVSRRLVLYPLLGRRRRVALARIGNDWWVPTSGLGPSSVCYLAGVGEDISLDLGLIERFGCEVHAFDPTPRAIGYVGGLKDADPKFILHPIGLWSEDTTLKFFVPADPTAVSYSALNLESTSDYIEAPVQRISTIMGDLGHDRIDLLKLDIEGAEYEVLDDLLTENIPCGTILVEFDQPMPLRRTLQAVKRLKERGFVVVKTHKWNVSLVNEGERN